DSETCAPERITEVAGALSVIHSADFEVPPEVMNAYLTSARRIAEAEIANIPIDDPTETVRYVVLGTALAGPLLLALRRLAEQATSVERFAAGNRHTADGDGEPNASQ
ncbi:MAG: hypothetical protein ACTH31_02050, partial [Pseudoclavibacter sp.]